MLADELETRLGAPVTLDVLKEKPGRRRTMRAVGARRTAIVKVYASERAPIVAARVAALRDGPREPRLPEVLLVRPSDHAVVLSEVPGTPMGELVLAGDSLATRRAGRAVGSWHLAWQSRCPEVLREHTVERELGILDGRAGEASALTAEAVQVATRELAEPWPCSTVVHRDLYEDQIVLGKEVGLIDLDDAACGPPELDVGNLLAHLELLALRRDRDLEPVIDAFLAGYAESGAILHSGRLEQCRRLTLLRLGCIHEEPRLHRAARAASPNRSPIASRTAAARSRAESGSTAKARS
jgi:Ser/Thr protein kinase RdoA (MazF antagonist)